MLSLYGGNAGSSLDPNGRARLDVGPGWWRWDWPSPRTPLEAALPAGCRPRQGERFPTTGPFARCRGRHAARTVRI